MVSGVKGVVIRGKTERKKRTAISKWLLPRSPPVFDACTTIFLPATGPLVKVSS
jgi:hypothetical protein